MSENSKLLSGGRVRFFIFGCWLLSLVLTIVTFVALIIVQEMTLAQISQSLTKAVGILVPQLSMVIAFYFKTSDEAAERAASSRPQATTVALVLTGVFHLVFLALLVLGPWKGLLGETLDENTEAMVLLATYLAPSAVAPVAYLFAGE